MLNGPNRRRQQCDEGWTLYLAARARASRARTSGADFHYYNWVDQYDTLGLGKNTPLANGSSSDSFLALDTKTKQWVVLRVPYPLGFHQRGMDGRIDDPDAGWKGRGICATYGTHAMWHIEGGPKEKNALVKFQVRPDPLAR